MLQMTESVPEVVFCSMSMHRGLEMSQRSGDMLEVVMIVVLLSQVWLRDRVITLLRISRGLNSRSRRSFLHCSSATKGSFDNWSFPQ
jgi:hypothetical protein